MSAKVFHETRSFACDPALAMPRGLRVHPDANGVLQPAGTGVDIGVLETSVVANVGQSEVAVRLRRNSQLFIASGAIAAFASFQTAASGKIATGGTAVGIVFQAATANNDLVEGMYY